jgi:hypothetical protein
MPAISNFFGIAIKMYSESNGKHHIPHFHAEYQDDEASYDFDGELLDGKLPNKQHKIVAAWATIHKDELNACWELLSKKGGFIKIPPIK